MESERFAIDTSGEIVVEITDRVQAFAGGKGEGLVNVFVPHATAGVTLMETGAGSEQDLAAVIEEILPRDDRYRHRHGSAGHGADHLLPAFVGPSVTIPVDGRGLVLGTWQRVVLVDTNRENNRRTVVLSFLPG
jgi:secondary thiamine-phosphate synthase enzyme